MSIFLKRLFRASRASHSVVGLIYLFVTLTVPLYHTCGLAGQCCKSCNCDDSYYYSRCKISSCNQPNIFSKKINHKASGLPNPSLCMACMYSVTSNATQVNTTVAFLRNEVPTFTQSLPSLSIIKQSEWLSSISLRAPPLMPS